MSHMFASPSDLLRRPRLRNPAARIFSTAGSIPLTSPSVQRDGRRAGECAVKFARMATARSADIAFTGAFHGRTLMATALTGKVSNYKRGFGPMPPEVFHLPFPNSEGRAPGETLQSLDRLFAAS